MRVWKVAAAVTALGAAVHFGPSLLPSRGVVPLGPVKQIASSQSAALFVGVRKFEHKDTVEVPFAVDDAVDLAFLFALDRRVGFVPPHRVVLALSGSPQKPESRERLRKLKTAGARVERAEPSNILTLLENQAELAGSDGALVVSIATHGFVQEGVPYILGSTSRFDYPETALRLPPLLDIAARTERSLIFVDACRERIALGTRSVSPHPATAAPLLEKMNRRSGQVVFYGAAAGGYTFDDNGNGVFTKAILDGLRCHATATRKLVTVENLRMFVEQQVLDWIHKHLNPSIEFATQTSIDGNMHLLPLAMCPPPPVPDPIVRVTNDGSSVTAFTHGNRRLWEANVGGKVATASVTDLDVDGSEEVVVATATSLVTLDRGAKRLWSAEEGMDLLTFTIGDRPEGSTQQIVAVWADDQSLKSRLVSYDSTGQHIAKHDHDTALSSVALFRPTNKFDPRVVAAGMNEIVLLHKLKPAWSYPLKSRLKKLEIIDCNDDRRKDIAVVTATGRLCLTVEGKLLDR